MKLSDTKCRGQKPADKPIKLSDGGGLYLEVMPNGNRFWRQKFRYAGKEKRLTHGKYPLVSLAEAREKREETKKLLLQGIDPSLAKKQHKITAAHNAAITFEAIGREWHEHKKPEWSEKYANTVMTRMEADIFPIIGKFPMESISPSILLSMLRGIEARGDTVLQFSWHAASQCSYE